MSSLFSDPDLIAAVRNHVAPRLRTYPTARVWVPACGTGEDAISIAIALREERVPRLMVYATDGDAAALDRARGGSLSREALSRERYVASGGRAVVEEYFADEGARVSVRPAILASILFCEHVLGTDGSINEFQLVFGGKALTDLPGEAKRRALEVMDESLCLLGWLGLSDPSLSLLLPSGTAYEKAPETRLWKKLR